MFWQKSAVFNGPFINILANPGSTWLFSFGSECDSAFVDNFKMLTDYHQFNNEKEERNEETIASSLKYEPE